MIVLAVTAWGTSVEQAGALLAPLLGVTAYDLRLRLSGPLPVVVSPSCSKEQAQTWGSALQSAGHQVVLCRQDAVAASAGMFRPRHFTLGPTAVSAMDAARGQTNVPYTEILALLEATSLNEVSETTTTKEKQLSLGRAAMTGGLIRNKSVTTETQGHVSERAQTLYVIRTSGHDSLFFHEHALHYEGLGAARAATTGQNFSVLCEELALRAPSARRDRSMVERPRRPTSLQLSAAGSRRSQGNASECDLVAHILALAEHRRRAQT